VFCSRGVSHNVEIWCVCVCVRVRVRVRVHVHVCVRVSVWKSEVDEGCLVLNAYLLDVPWFAINSFGNPNI